MSLFLHSLEGDPFGGCCAVLRWMAVRRISLALCQSSLYWNKLKRKSQEAFLSIKIIIGTPVISQVTSEIESGRKEGKMNVGKGSISWRNFSPLLHIHPLPLLLPLLDVSWMLRGCLPVFDRADVSSRGGKTVHKRRINLKRKRLFGAWSSLLAESWRQWVQLRSSVWFCRSHRSTRKGTLVFMRALAGDLTGLEERLCLSLR